MSRGFAGQHIVITGGSSGIGHQLAKDFLQLGARVSIVADRAATLERARVELAALGPVRAFVCDIADISQVRAMAAACVQEWGAPDVLINNAGYAVYRTFEEMDSEEIARLVQVNLTGGCVVTREFLPSMIRSGRGDILFVASIAGRLPMTPCGPYSTAKHGMVAFAEILHSEVARFGLRVQVVCPGRVETGFFSHETFQQRAPRRETEWTIPLERVSAGIIGAIRKNRFMTYVPRTYGPLVWLTQALPFVFRPALRKLMRARVETVYASKQS